MLLKRQVIKVYFCANSHSFRDIKLCTFRLQKLGQGHWVNCHNEAFRLHKSKSTKVVLCIFALALVNSDILTFQIVGLYKISHGHGLELLQWRPSMKNMKINKRNFTCLIFTNMRTKVTLGRRNGQHPGNRRNRADLSKNNLRRLHNSIARIVTEMCTRKFDNITPVLRRLHWLPIQSRITYQAGLLTQMHKGTKNRSNRVCIVAPTAARTCSWHTIMNTSTFRSAWRFFELLSLFAL